MHPLETLAPEIGSALSRLLGTGIVSIERMGGGRNSRVYRVDYGTSGCCVLKLYPGGEPDGRRDRLEVEFTALKFLGENGVECVPRPVAADRAGRWAAYEYVDGQKIPSSQATAPDIDQAVRFLVQLKELGRRPESAWLPAAAEACLSVRAIFDSIETRLSRLRGLSEQGPQYLALRELLAGEYSPFLAEVRARCEAAVKGSRRSMAAELEPEERTLSPSDFGFHNALKRPDGRIMFLDFEYFGWDDPAKMIADFLLHPAMELPESLKQRFVAEVIPRFEATMSLTRRIEAVYPLLGLKWCLILLNEFVPEYLLRRGFASRFALDVPRLQAQQLAKARGMLHRVRSEYEHFPYLG